jgi:AcrR family transcriptional regulator
MNEIVNTATKMFLTLGFKSVTMDDVAAKMGISKKTIYKYFENKEELIEACVDHVHHEIRVKMTTIFELQKNAVEENFLIRDMFNDMFKTDGDSPVYQLKKHYPIIYERVRERELNQCKEFFTANIIKGIAQGYYKENTPVEYAVLFYYMLIFSINENFPSEKEVTKIELEALKYHTYAIATPKGIIELEKQLKNLNS